MSLSAGAAVLVVMAAFGLLLHQRARAEIRAWERENLAALGHHTAQMIGDSAREDRAATVARLGEELRGFGVELHVTDPPGEGVERASAAGRPAGVPAVRVPLDEPESEVVVIRRQSITATLGKRLFTLYAVLLGLVALSLVAVIHASVHWSLVRPLRRVQAQLRQMVRGPWASYASEDGTHEVASLAREVEAVGTNLSERVPQWIEAERKAASELARRRLRQRALPELRVLNLLVGNLLARGDLSRDMVRDLRGAQAASDRLAIVLDIPIHRELSSKSGGRLRIEGRVWPTPPRSAAPPAPVPSARIPGVPGGPRVERKREVTRSDCKGPERVPSAPVTDGEPGADAPSHRRSTTEESTEGGM